MKVFTIALVSLLLTVSYVFGGGQAENNTMMMSSETMEPGQGAGFIEFKSMDEAMILAKTKPTVLFFHASWCPSCKSAMEDFKANMEELKGVNLIIVDYDNSGELKKKYGVTYQHTFVEISPDGSELAKWNGGGTAELLDNISMDNASMKEM